MKIFLHFVIKPIKDCVELFFLVPASVVSSHFARNPSIYFRSGKDLVQKLDKLLDTGVASDSILSAPATFGMSLRKIEHRLADLKSKTIEPISSWMITASASQFDL